MNTAFVGVIAGTAPVLTGFFGGLRAPGKPVAPYAVHTPIHRSAAAHHMPHVR